MGQPTRFVAKLDNFELWLLAELYGPTCFYARERTLKRAFIAAQRRFAGRSASVRDFARIHRGLIGRLADDFCEDGLIRNAVAARAMREAG